MAIVTDPHGVLSRIVQDTNARRTGDGKWQATCPAHEDRKASLCIARGDKQPVVLFCQAGCSSKAVLAALGLDIKDVMAERDSTSWKPTAQPQSKAAKKIVAEYDYLQADGTLQFQVVRFEPKDFRQRQPKPGPQGGWQWNLKGISKPTLYRLQEVMEAEEVLLVEGEKDADNAADKLGMVATTNAGGAKKFRDHHAKYLAGKRVTIIPDNDPSGMAHVQQVADMLEGVASSVIILELPNLPKKGDLSDWIEQGGTADELKQLIRKSQPIEPMSFNSLLSNFPKLRKPIIEGLLREGETCNIIAATKIGKSWLGADLAMSVATGRPWLKQIETHQGPVLYIDNELHPETLSFRLDGISRCRGYDRSALTQNFSALPVRGLNLDINRLWPFLDRLKIAPKLVILDAWYRFMPEGMSENDNAQMMAQYNLLDSYAKALDAAFIVVHHSSKGDQSAKSVTDVGSGAGSMSRAADTHLTIRPHQTEGMAVMEAATRSWAPPEPRSLFFTWPCWYIGVDEPEVRTSKSAFQESKDKERRENVTEVAKKFESSEFTRHDVRQLLGCGQDRANAIIRAGVQWEEFTQTGEQKNAHSSKPTPVYSVTKTTAPTTAPDCDEEPS